MAFVTATSSRRTRRRKPIYEDVPEPEDAHIGAEPAPAPAPIGARS
jgi:hypothetical protein